MSADAKMVRVLPPDVFDALELSSEAFGGVGHGQFRDFDANVYDDRTPCCIHGHAAFLDPDRYGPAYWLAKARIGADVNDGAFDTRYETRIPFEEWCRRLNVVRGDTPTFDPEFVKSLRPTQRDET